ncbi:hypothetical protein PYCCODRAFT_375970 [Trametes coccinea BRFM310]|uniref:Uncharacterized protein n=1 Tax=Trametes coccinea (strain BRFM310) TaxID=1353009 RepID=A0A1Y2J6B1_TRAC3|nr:hypothetical protein PYCCODRAFT_375970 [Trametes coccinea BRFM310]
MSQVINTRRESAWVPKKEGPSTAQPSCSGRPNFPSTLVGARDWEAALALNLPSHALAVAVAVAGQSHPAAVPNSPRLHGALACAYMATTTTHLQCVFGFSLLRGHWSAPCPPQTTQLPLLRLVARRRVGGKTIKFGSTHKSHNLQRATPRSSRACAPGSRRLVVHSQLAEKKAARTAEFEEAALTEAKHEKVTDGVGNLPSLAFIAALIRALWVRVVSSHARSLCPTTRRF